MFGKKKKSKDAHDAPADQADNPSAEGADGEVVEGGGKKKPPLKLIIIGAVAAVVVLGGGGTAAMLLMKGGDKAHQGDKPEKKEEKKKEGHGEAAKPPEGVVVADGPDGVVFYTLPSMVVNMQTADGRPTFLKLKLTLELPDSETAAVLNPNIPRMTDMFQMFLRELRPEDLSGSQGGYQLRMEILRRVNLVIAPAKVNSVLIEEMLIN